MNENDKHEQEQPVTKWPGYASLVLAFSILFALAVLGVGFLGLRGAINVADLLQFWPVKDQSKQVITALALGLAFFAGAFFFLALKTKTEQSEAAGKAVVWVCRILFYPIHVAIRTFVRFIAIVLLFVSVAGGVGLIYVLYMLLEPCLEKVGDVVTAFFGVSIISALIYALPNYVLPIVKKSMENIEKITDGISGLYMFPGMVASESWSYTIDTVKKIDSEVVRLFINLLLLIVFSMFAVSGFSALDAAVTDENTVAPPEMKSSYVFLGNMPWIVGNVQSFFSSAVVFPMDAKPEDLMAEAEAEAENALALAPEDRQFYQAVYKPLLADLKRCGTSDNKVKIELSGFSSTAKIESCRHWNTIRDACLGIKPEQQTCEITKSDESSIINEVFNLCVANKRAEHVKGMLEDFVEDIEPQENVFEFTVKEWESLGQMQKQTNKIFCDAPKPSNKQPTDSGQDNKGICPKDGKYNPTRGMMNRRVDVAITDTPLCMM